MCAASRFGKPRFFPVRETDCHFLRRAKSNQKARGTPSCDLDSKLYRRKILAKISDGTSRNRFFAQDDGEKALNRCDAPTLQRKDLERTTKEQPCSLQTVGYGWVRRDGVCGGKGLLLRAIRKGLCG